MADTSAQIQIPDRALFKASEVCDLVKVQPYVLRSWEAEFPNLGVARGEGSGRVYRREDVELALRIKHHVLVDGLTLAGVRRRLEDDQQPTLPLIPAPTNVAVSSTVRDQLASVKRGLQELLEMLAPAGAMEMVGAATAVAGDGVRSATDAEKSGTTKSAPRRAARSKRTSSGDA